MRRRFFVEQFENGHAILRGDAAHHLGRVLRAQEGQLYELSDGTRLFLGRVERVDRETVDFSLLEEVESRSLRLHVALLLAIVKFDAFEWAIEKATELGVSRIVPLAAARSEKSLVSAAPKRADRWRKILFEASQQSRRLALPEFGSVVEPAEAFRASSAAKIILSERPSTPSLKKVLQGVNSESVLVAIGPEGGWTDAELASASAAGFREASLGDLILRTETAVAATLASINYELGNYALGGE